MARKPCDLAALDTNPHIRRDFKRHDLVAKLVNPAYQAAVGNDLIVALERGEHLRVLLRLFRLGPNYQEIENAEQQSERDDGRKHHLLAGC